ncbi:hypothetical protein A3K93_10370 [Acinetobacter sp. NCu2D-2]|uniref:hypothetical protein n=1 Tax=Acinetobacter sp. NCu2D-2 TaxID=1608473 RepID=UPI0007CDD810|nr:hypothetical protein [Acinetobacter sp. NCu2D-2]ANF82552.1 hypothetical protein A3K93_10370 [Acinetobacter sp. NCu2D-2]
MSVNEKNNQKLLMGIIGGLIAIVALIAGYQWFMSSQQTEQAEEVLIAPTSSKEDNSPSSTIQTDVTPESSQTKKLVDDDLLQAEIPENPTLAQDELAKLDDIQAQLKEQQQTLAAQHQDADQLIALKEEQIKLLGAQLAQGK